MGIDVWGMIPKNMEDPEKIEEAIVRIVNAHNSDPIAHLGSGESLSIHRSQENIDHLPRSIGADNLKEGAVAILERQYSEQESETLFEHIDSLEILSIGGAYAVQEWPCILLCCSHSSPSSVEVHPLSWPVDFCSGDFDWVWQVTCEVIGNLDLAKRAFWGVGFHSDFTVSGNRSAVGFKIENNKLYALAVNTFLPGSPEIVVEISGIDVSNPHVYRIFWNSDKDRHEYFVNGDLVATISSIRGPIGETNGFNFFVENDSASVWALLCTDLKVSAHPVPYA